MYTNADSLLNKRAELEVLILEHKPEILAITEIKAKRQVSLENVEYTIPGYTLFLNQKPELGVALYVKESLNAVECPELNAQAFQEAVWCSFESMSKVKVLLGCIYKSPNSNDDNVKNLLDMMLSDVLKCYDKICVMGDFNYPNVCWQGNWTSTKDETFIECIRDAYLYQMVKAPTRRRGDQRPTLDDLILVNDETLISDITHLSPLGKSDHDVLLFSLYIEQDPPEAQDIERFDLSKVDYHKMREEVETADWSNLHLDDVENIWLRIKKTIIDSMNRNIPKVSTKLSKTKKPDWMTGAVRNSVKKKHALFQRYLKSKASYDYQRYIKCRNECNSIIKKAKRQYEKDIALKCKDNPKQFWRYVKNKTKSLTSISPLDKGNGDLVVADKDKANVLNSFFSSVFTKEDLSDFPPEDLGSRSDGALLTEILITPAAVRDRLAGLCANKAQGPDGLPPRVLKELCSPLAHPLSVLFNKSIETGKIPLDWKNADVVAIFKKGTRSDPGNYRPVSLTCVLCKVLENFVRDSVVNYMSDLNLYSDSQHGFRKKRSCVTQLLEVMEQLTNCFDDGYPVDMVYLDFRKAFDSVPHKRLLCKMKYYGISGKVIDWVEDFLSDRVQRVRVGREFSSSSPVLSGIPQGSVLGPVLFTIFINDILDEVESDCKIFADDTKMYNKAADKHILQADILRLQEWTNVWKLFFNVNKCCVVHFGRNNPCYDFVMNANGSVVSVAKGTEERDLGVVFDKELTFDAHIQAVIAKANRVLGIIRRSFTFLNKEIFLNLYKSMVRPYLEYASAVWSPRFRRQSVALERVQRRATRLLGELRDRDYEQRLYKLNLPSLKYRRYRGDLLQTFKILNHIDDVNSESFFTLNKNNTRGAERGNLIIKHCNLNVKHNSFSYRAAQYWNSLSADTKQAKDLNQFKRLLDTDPNRKFFRNSID